MKALLLLSTLSIGMGNSLKATHSFEFERADEKMLANKVGDFGLSPLMQAVFSNSTDTIRTLIKAGAELETQHEVEGCTALIFAAKSGDIEAVQLLLQNGAKPDSQDFGGYTAFKEAALRGHLEVADILLKWGANINIRDKNGLNVLNSAEFRGETKVVEYLKSRGAQG